MKLEIIIPTYKRQKKLIRTLASVKLALTHLPPNVVTSVNVYYSTPEEWLDAAKVVGRKWVNHHLLEPTKESFSVPKFWNDRLKNSQADMVCYLTDDVELNQFCLKVGVENLTRVDLDGLVGFCVFNINEPKQPCQASFGIMGKAFIDGFKNRRVFCPEYYLLFADCELEAYAKSVCKFKFVKDCILAHYHPSYVPAEHDETHEHIRENKMIDQAIYDARKKKGLIWGRSYELLG